MEITHIRSWRGNSISNCGLSGYGVQFISNKEEATCSKCILVEHKKHKAAEEWINGRPGRAKKKRGT
jgi:hypothetical protein